MTHDPSARRSSRISRGGAWRWLAVAIATAILIVPSALVGQRGARERHIFVAVANQDDAPITDLTAADFRVREDGVAREVLRVTPANDPMQIALLVDDSEIAQRAVTEIRNGVAGFVKQILDASPQSEITLMTFGDRPTTLVEWTSSAPALAKGIEKIFFRKGAGAVLMQAIDESARALKKKEAKRPAIVAFDIEDGVEFSNDSNESIARTLKDTGVPLWPVLLLEQRSPPTSPEARERAIVVSDVATESGGGNKRLISRQAIGLGFTWAATRLLSQLDVTYNRPEALIPPNKLDVEVTRRDVRVWAPHWGRQ